MSRVFAKLSIRRSASTSADTAITTELAAKNLPIGKRALLRSGAAALMLSRTTLLAHGVA